MHELYELKDMLCKELKDYGSKGELTPGTLEVVDKLAHAAKNIDKIIEAYEEEEGYSSRPYDDGMNGSYARRGGYSRNMGGSNRGSYARGRMNARRDSMGRYSRDDGLAEELRGLMDDAPNDTIKREMQRLVEKIEQQM